MVYLILDDVEKLEEVVQVWTDIGVGGMTVLQSVGMEALRDRCSRDDLPLFPSMEDLFERGEFPQRTIFAVVDDALVERLITETENVVGNFDEQYGVLFTVPVGRIIGNRRA